MKPVVTQTLKVGMAKNMKNIRTIRYVVLVTENYSMETDRKAKANSLMLLFESTIGNLSNTNYYAK
jgi:hypothetical protein